MMGSQDDRQDQFLYQFRLEDHVPKEHLLRHINEVLDLSGLRHHLAPFYSHTGRPSIDPELMIRMLIVGYCLGIRSERRLCEEVQLNLAYRWFCRLSIEDASARSLDVLEEPPRSLPRERSFPVRVRAGAASAALRRVWLGGEGFAVDASVVKADASRDGATTRRRR